MAGTFLRRGASAAFLYAGIGPRILLAADEGAGGGGGGGDQQQGGDKGAGGDPPPAFAAPDFLPDHLRGKDAAETLAKLAPDWKTQRDNLAQRQPTRPETPEGYEFTPADDIKQHFAEDVAKDPALSVLRKVAHEIDMPKDKFGPFISAAISGLAKAKLIGQPDPYAIDYDKEAKALVPQDKAGAPEAEQKAAVKARVDTAQTFIDTLKARGEIDEGMQEEFGLLLETAAGVRVVEFLHNHLTSEKGFQLGQGGGAAGGYSMADYNRDSNDPRYFSTSAKYDPAFRAEVDAKSKHLFK
jgi:hypothetical protein